MSQTSVIDCSWLKFEILLTQKIVEFILFAKEETNHMNKEEIDTDQWIYDIKDPYKFIISTMSPVQ